MAFTVEYRVRNGTPPYTVDLTGSELVNIHQGDGTFSFINVPEGTYDLDVIDSLGCFATLPVILVASTTTTIEPIPTCQLISFQTQTTTSTNDDGTITVVSIIGGQGNITYSKDSGLNFQSSNVFSDLSDGLYTVCIKDDIVTDCTLCQPVNVFKTLQLPDYALTIENIIPEFYEGTADGSENNPYPSNIDINFNIVGNGGTGSTFPLTYTLKMFAAQRNAHGIDYQGISYNNNIIIQTTSPRGNMTTQSEVDVFNGGSGVGPSQHSMLFYNADFSLGPALMGFILLIGGVEQDILELWIDDGGVIP